MMSPLVKSCIAAATSAFAERTTGVQPIAEKIAASDSVINEWLFFMVRYLLRRISFSIT